MGELVWLPWSVVAWVLTILWMIFLVGASAPIMLVVPFERFQLRFPHPQTAWPLWLAFSRLRVTRDPGYDPTKVSIFVQNHVSMLDACIACGSIRVPLCGLENAAHLRVPGYGWLMRAANAIPVHRTAHDRFLRIAEAIRERASRGISILTFPEAHRTLDGRLRPFKRGVFAMARDAGLPIVPIAVRGAYRMLPKGRFTIRPSTIEVYIAPQIETKGLSNEQLSLLMERVREVIMAWVERGEKLGHLCTEPLSTASADAAQ